MRFPICSCAGFSLHRGYMGLQLCGPKCGLQESLQVWIQQPCRVGSHGDPSMGLDAAVQCQSEWARNREVSQMGQRLNWTKPWHGPNWWQNFWTLSLLGLLKTRLDFFHSRMEMNHLSVDEIRTLGTWRQSFAFAPASINLTTAPHPLTWVPAMLFLQLCGRTPFSLATVLMG